MAAALWDLTWDLGGGWRAQLSRHDQADAVLPVSPPVTLEVRHIDEPSSVTPLLSITGAIATDFSMADLIVTPEQMATLQVGRYEHRIIVGTGAGNPPEVLLRGYVTVRDTVGGS